MDFSFFAHRFFKENLWIFFSQMPAALGICGTIYKAKKEENLFLGEIWLPPQNARTRVRLVYLHLTCVRWHMRQIWHFWHKWPIYIWLKLTRTYIPTRRMSPNCLHSRTSHAFIFYRNRMGFFSSGQELPLDR